MKKLILSILVISLLVLTACSKDVTPEEVYADAVQKYENAKFEEAKELFSSLSGYEASDDYFLYCDLMISLQGKYYNKRTGDAAFTINGFKVLNYIYGDATIKITSSNKIEFVTDELTTKTSLKYEDSKIVLTVHYKQSGDTNYIKLD